MYTKSCKIAKGQVMQGEIKQRGAIKMSTLVEKEVMAPAVTAKITIPEGKIYTLNYYFENYQEEDGTRQFGIKVDKLDPTGSVVERSATSAIAKDRDSIMDMMLKCAEGTVTPCTIQEIIDDMAV